MKPVGAITPLWPGRSLLHARTIPWKTFTRTLVASTPRNCTATEENKTPDLRKLLRKFYLKVHPDLFTSHPRERVTNQNSLKELTSFTEEWMKNTSQSTFLPKTQKQIQFYLKKKPTGEPSNELNESPDAEGDNAFALHTMTLVSNGSFTEVQSQYSKLFAQVGLPTTFLVGEKSNELADFNFMDEFLVKHKETARENVKREEEASTEVGEIIFRFKHHFNITINTDSVFHNHFYFQNRDSLLQLYRAVESLRETDPQVMAALSGCVVSLDSATVNYAVDYATGRIFVDRDGTSMEHLRHLRALKIDELRAGIQNRDKNESELEKEFKQSQGILDKFARQIGVKSIEMAEESSFYTDDYQMDENGQERLPYNREKEMLLYRRLAGKVRDEYRHLARPWPKGKMRQVPVEIRSLYDKEYFVSASPSLIVSPEVSPARFLSIIHEHGSEVSTRIQELDGLRNTMHFIMARMGLESINIQFLIQSDPEGHKKVVSAIKKLEKVAGELRKFDLTGLSLGIDNQYNVEADGTLWIKWNFQMETLKKLMGKINERKEQQKKEQQAAPKE